MPTELQAAVALILAWAVWIAFTDIRQQRIPNFLLLAALIPCVMTLLLIGHSPLGANGFDAASGLFAAFFLTFPGYFADKLGAGDVKLAAVLGLMQGLHGVLFTLLLAALLLGAASLAMVHVLGREGARGESLPAGAALCAGFAASLCSLLWLN